MAKKDYKDDFQNWCDMWDQACEKNIFPEAPKLDPLPETDDFDDAAEDYYHNIDRQASEEGLLQEAVADYSANPIYPDTVGKDSGVTHPWVYEKTPWVDDDAIQLVADLKKQLYDVECKLNAKDAGGSKWNETPVVVNDKALWRQIESIKERLDKLSDTLGFKDEPNISLYRTKRSNVILPIGNQST